MDGNAQCLVLARRQINGNQRTIAISRQCADLGVGAHRKNGMSKGAEQESSRISEFWIWLNQKDRTQI